MEGNVYKWFTTICLFSIAVFLIFRVTACAQITGRIDPLGSPQNISAEPSKGR